MPSERLKFEAYDTYTAKGSKLEAEYQSLYFPGLGNVTITFEQNPSWEDLKEPHMVLSIDFMTDRVRVIDMNGNDRRIG